MKHKTTKRPWHVSGFVDGSGKYLHIGSMSSPMVLASMNDCHTETEGNAKLICEAVNAYDTLIKECDYKEGRITGLEQDVEGLKARADMFDELVTKLEQCEFDLIFEGLYTEGKNPCTLTLQKAKELKQNETIKG